LLGTRVKLLAVFLVFEEDPDPLCFPEEVWIFMGHLNISLVKESNPAKSNWLRLPRAGRFGKLARAHRKEEASPQKICRMVFLDVPDLGRGKM